MNCLKLTSEDVISKLSSEELSHLVLLDGAFEKLEHTGIFLCGMTTLLFFPGGTS